MKRSGLLFSRLHILFEDNHLLVLNKHCGVLSQPDKSGIPSLLDLAKEYLQEKYNKPGAAYLGLIHRIDRPCSGVMLFAKTSKAASRISGEFRSRHVRKIYACVANGIVLKDGTCDHLIEKTTKEKVRVYDIRPNLSTNTPPTVRKYNNAVPAVLSYKVLASYMEGTSPSTFKSQSLLLIHLETGRKHQIRAQLSHIGHPIVGDTKYGAPQQFNSRDISLHALCLQLVHPVSGEVLLISAPVPAHWRSRFGDETVNKLEAFVLSWKRGTGGSMT